MRKFYHFCFTCPQCHVPYKGPTSDIVQLSFLENNNLCCSECETEFHPYVDVSTKIPTINEQFKLSGIQPVSPKMSVIPLFWNVTLNSIENDYLQWLLKKPEGIFLITWPWADVRFLPLLLTEYCLSNNDEKIVIIGDYEEVDKDQKFITGYTLPEIIKKTIFINDPIPANEVLKTEINQLKADRSMVFDLKTVVSVKFRKYGSGDIETSICQDTLRKCLNKIKKDVDGFGSSYLRTIIQKKKNGPEKKSFDPNGLWDVTLIEQEQWSGKLNYNVLWLGEVLANYEKIIWCQDILKSVCYFTANDQTYNLSANVHQISSKLDPDKLFSLIRRISPNLLIIENADYLVSDIRYNGPFSKELMDYLKAPAKTVLLFSTNPERRHLYKMESEKNIFFPIPVTIQTLDSGHVLTQLPVNFTESRFPNPLSSMLGDVVEGRNKKIISQFSESKALTDFFEKLSPILSIVNDEFARNIRFYLRRVISSPLNIIGDYSDLRYLTARKGFTGQNITYDWIYTELEDYADSEKIPKDIPDLFRATFHSEYLPEESKNTNPLRDDFFRNAKEILGKNSSAHVTFVVNPQDTKGLEKIIQETENFDAVTKQRLDVFSWGNLKENEKTIKKINPDCSHYVISSQYPSLSYDLRNSRIKEFIFISDHRGIEGIKEIIDYRLLERFSFPVVRPHVDWSMPEFLRGALEKIDLPDTTRINDIYRDIDDDVVFQFSDWNVGVKDHREMSDTTGNLVIAGIDVGEEVFLCIDRAERGVFIPPGKSVMVRKGEFFDDIHIDETLSDTKIEKMLMNQEIILDKSGLLLSFKAIFFTFMMGHGKRMTFQKGPYTWIGYENLFNDSIYWIQLIEKAIEDYPKKYPGNSKNPELEISTKLTESGITAREIVTVLGWLNHYDEISINLDSYKLYRTEHPFRLEDIRIIYAVLQDFVPMNNLKLIDPDKVYAAALCLQEFRRKVFQSTPHDNSSFFNVRMGFKKELNNLDTEGFLPIVVKRVRLAKAVESMKIIPNYSHYLVV